MAYRAKLAYLADHRARTFGLGVTITAMLFVPGLNLIALGLGLGAAGATTTMVDQFVGSRLSIVGFVRTLFFPAAF